MRKFKKINWRGILSAILVGVLLVGSVAGLGAVFGKDTKNISSTAFSVGAIDENGNYVKSDVSIYTKDLFECQGLSIEPDFEATGTYRVFYYSEDKNFIGSTDALNAADGVYNKGAEYAFATYARVMITPEVPVDEDGNEEEEFKIRFYEAVSYASDYTISVNKKQDSSNYPVKGENKLVFYENTGVSISDGVNGFTLDIGGADFNVSDLVSTVGCRKICVAGDPSTFAKLRVDFLKADVNAGYAELNDSMMWDYKVVDGITFAITEVPAECAGILLYNSDGSVDFSAFGLFVW